MSLTFTDSALVGLAVSSCLTLTGLLQWGMQQNAETENQMVSVERVLEYSNLEPEPPLESAPGNPDKLFMLQLVSYLPNMHSEEHFCIIDELI